MSGDAVGVYADRGDHPDAARRLRDSEKPEPIFTRLFTCLMISNGALRIATTMLITLVPLYVLSRGESTLVAGLTTTIFMLSAVLARPIAGRLVDARGRYATMAVGSLLFTVGVALTTLTLPMVGFLVIRVLQGVGFSLNGTAAMTLATDLIPGRRMAQGIGYLGLEATLAVVVGPWLALFMARRSGYTLAFGVVACLALVTVFLRLPLRRRLMHLDQERRERAETAKIQGLGGGRATRSRTPLLTRVVDRDALRPALILFFVMFAAASTNTFLPAYVLDKGISQAGLFFAASGLAAAVARLVVGRLDNRVGTAWTIGSGIGSMTVALMGVFWSPNLAVLIAAGVLSGLAMGVIQPGIAALAVLAAPKERRGMANSTVFLAMDLAQALGALTLGAIAGVAGTGSVFLVAAFVSGGALLVWAVALSREKNR